MTLELRPGISSVVSYFGVPNESYSIGYSFDLIDWEEAHPQSSGAGPMSWEFPATAFQVFYRVKLLP